MGRCGGAVFLLRCWVSSVALGELVTVKMDTWTKVSEAALQEARPVWESVETACVLRIKSSSPAKVGMRGGRLDEGAHLCRVDLGDYGGADGDKAAVLALVDSTAYLERPGNWEAFLNKCAYCAKTRRRLYVWIGNLPRAVLDERPGDLPWMSCKEKPGNTLNIYKAIAFLALFASEDPPASVLYLDADAWFSDLAFEESGDAATPERYLGLSRQAALVGNQNRVGGPKIPMNGGLLLVRKEAWALHFLALWWRSRCGPHDQLPLWASLFSTWAATAGGDYAFETDEFSTYGAAHGAAVERLMRDASRLRALAKIGGDLDGGTFDKTGVLTAPLELPNVLLLPSAAFRGLPAIRSDVDKTKRTFACHTRPGKAEKGTQCTGDAVCADAKCFPFVGGQLPSASAPRPGAAAPTASRTLVALAILAAFLAPYAWTLRRHPNLAQGLARRVIGPR